MFGSQILEVAIGLIFIFLLLSLICSAIQEMIEAGLKYRATDLERGIRELLNQDSSLVKKVYEHPLIYGLFRGEYTPGGKNLPSYIPARNFALALMDIVLPGQQGKPSGAADATVLDVSNLLQPLRKTISEIQNEQVKKALITLTDRAEKAVPTLRRVINENNDLNDKVKQGLLTLVDAAGNDPVKVRENIETWFNSSMDRVSGWYKRRAQTILFGVGLLIAVVINVDTINIARNLSIDKPLRDSLAATAQEYAKKASPPSSQTSPPANNIEACKKDENSPECRRAKACKDENSPECRVETNLQTIQELGLPIGWSVIHPKSCQEWLLRIVGWLLTAFAVSLGAPFWFDLLNKFMVARSTVKPTEKSPEEKSKD